MEGQILACSIGMACRWYWWWLYWLETVGGFGVHLVGDWQRLSCCHSCDVCCLLVS